MEDRVVEIAGKTSHHFFNGGVMWPKIDPPHPDAVDHFVTAPTLPRVYRAWTDDGQPFLIGEAGLEAYGPDILKPPHLVKLPPQEGAKPMTEDDLAALEDRIATVSPYGEADELHSAYLDDVPCLIAEVRRLNAANARLREVARECERRGDIIAELRTGLRETNALLNPALRHAARAREALREAIGAMEDGRAVLDRPSALDAGIAAARAALDSPNHRRQ